jgi:hypothetical protein
MGVTSFFIECLCFEPFALRDCLIYYWRSLFWDPCVTGLPLFLSEVFVLSPLHYGVASFFIGGICFESMNEGCLNAPSFMALAYLV